MDVRTFRNNLFNMNTRRFGTVTELLVKELLKVYAPDSPHYDLVSAEGNRRVEVKFSRAEKKHKKKINENTVMDVIANEGLDVRLFPSHYADQVEFDCNIQQVKPREFDVLFYGVLYSDLIEVYALTPADLILDDSIQYCDKQHKGNVGEGQFHINTRTIAHHVKYKQLDISYTKAMELLGGVENDSKTLQRTF